MIANATDTNKNKLRSSDCFQKISANKNGTPTCPEKNWSPPKNILVIVEPKSDEAFVAYGAICVRDTNPARISQNNASE